MTEEINEEVKVDQQAEEDPDVGKALFAFSGSPSRDEIDKWKTQYGDVYCSGLSPTELFIFRPLKRKEFVEMQIALSQNQGNQFGSEENTVRTCLLWASEPGMASMETKAGTLATLNEQVLQNSNFVSPMVASALV